MFLRILLDIEIGPQPLSCWRPHTGESFMNTALATEYVAHYRTVKQAEAQLQALKAQREAMERQLIAEFALAGIQSIRTELGIAYLSRNLYARLIGPAMSLIDTPLEYLAELKVNANSLSAAVREFPRDDNDMPILPEEVMDKLQVDEIFRIDVKA
jgi:hypothetical protein